MVVGVPVAVDALPALAPASDAPSRAALGMMARQARRPARVVG